LRAVREGAAPSRGTRVGRVGVSLVPGGDELVREGGGHAPSRKRRSYSPLECLRPHPGEQRALSPAGRGTSRTQPGVGERNMAEPKVIAVVGATGAQGGGLAHAILRDKAGGFRVRALTRHPTSDKAKELAKSGAEVVAAELDDTGSLTRAFRGTYGAFC